MTLPWTEHSSSWKHANFLHYGSALREAQILRNLPASSVDKKLLLNIIEMTHPKADLAAVVRGYGGKRKKKIRVADLERDLSRSHSLQSFFRNLACRGFSHRIERGIKLQEQLRPDIDLRLAVMSDESLFYPPSVKKHLRRVENNHYFSKGFPSIAFALGEKRVDGWYIYVMQSDIVRTRCAFVRDHFRGWRKVLFAYVLCEAVENTTDVFLCSAVDVVRTCRPEFPRPVEVPDSWITTYDHTARFFHMQRVQVSSPINIQIYSDLPAVLTSQFYHFAVTRQSTETLRLLPEERA